MVMVRVRVRVRVRARVRVRYIARDEMAKNSSREDRTRPDKTPEGTVMPNKKESRPKDKRSLGLGLGLGLRLGIGLGLALHRL